MYARGSHRARLFVLVPLSFLLLFVVACGTSGTSSSTTTGAAVATATCPPNRFKTASGTLQSVSTNSLVVKNAQGTDVQASYTKTTRFQQETQATTSALKEGTYVSVTETPGADFYIATRIMLLGNRAPGTGTGTGTGRGNFGGTGTGRANGSGTGQARNASCFRREQGANAGTTGSATGSAAGGSNVTGTVSQVSTSTLTVTDLQGSNYTLTLNGSTKVIQYKSATASELKTGVPLTVTGADNGKGGITAQSITVLLAGSKT